MLDFFTINQWPQPAFVDTIQIIKNKDGILEKNTSRKRKRIKEGTEENIFKAEDIKKIVLSKDSINNLSRLSITDTYVTIHYENDKKEKVQLIVTIPIAIIMDWNRIYGIEEKDDSYLLKLPKDMSELYLIEYLGVRENVFPVSSKFKAIENLLKIQNTDLNCSKDYVYCKNGAIHFFVEKVKRPVLSITSAKDKKMLSWKNKYKEAYLFVNMLGNRCIVNSVEEFSRKIEKTEFNNMIKDGSIRNFGIGIYDEKPFDEVSKEALNKMSNNNSNIENKLLKNDIFETLREFENSYEVIKELVENQTISVNKDNKNDINLLSKLQRCLTKVITSQEFNSIGDILEKIDIKLENFKFDKKDIKSNHHYLCCGAEYIYNNSRFVLLGEYFFKSFDINGKNSQVNITTNDKYCKEFVFIDTYNIAELVNAVNGKSNCSNDKIRHCPVENILPVYDEGVISTNIYNSYVYEFTDKEFNEFIENFPNYFSRTPILNLSNLLSRKDYQVNIKSNEDISINTPNFFSYQIVRNLFSNIGCKEEKDMIKMLETFSNFTLFLKLLEDLC